MLISTKQRAQSIQLLPDTEITAITNSAFSNRSSSPRSCSSSSTSSNSDKNSPNSPEVMSDNTTTNTNLDLNDGTSSSESAKTSDETSESLRDLSKENATSKKTSKNLDEEQKDSSLDEAANLNENIKIDSVDEIYEYWKNFEIQKLKNDLNEQIEDILQCQVDQDNLQSMYAELNQKLNDNSSEEFLKTLSPYLNRFQSNLDKFLALYKQTQSKGINLLKLLTNVPDPFPVIELVRQFSENQVYEQAYKLQAENRSLQENLNAYKYEISLMQKQESRQVEEEKELILNLSEQVGLTTSLNLELTSRLKLAEGEIESYKKILVDYQNEISGMKVKHLNEIKSEYSKESDKLKKIDSQSQISDSTNTTTTTTASTANTNNSKVDNTVTTANEVNNSSSSATSKSDKLTKTDQNNNLIKSANSSSRASSQPESSNHIMTTSSNKWLNSLSTSGSVNNDRLALLQSLTALSSANSKNTSATLKNLLNKTSSEQTQPSATTNSKSESHFKPIFKVKSEDLDTTNQTDTAYDSANDNDLDESEQDTINLKCLSPHGQQSHSSYEPINTADIAQKVRDLLSVHNIGQRVFAKFILGLSQGTVSELLSKPKHWDKLTEKGRESYRKMYNWSCSEHSISTLKAISPRKGNKDNYFYQNGSVKEETATTEDRINQILNEAQRQMQVKRTLSASPSPSGGSSAVSNSNQGSPSMSPTSHHDLLQKASAFLSRNSQHAYFNNKTNTNNNSSYDLDEEASMDEYETSETASRVQARPSHTNKRLNNDNNSDSSAYPLDLTVKTQQPNRMASGNFQSNTKRIKVESNDFTHNNSEDNDFVKATKKVLAASSSSMVSPLKHIQSIADAYLMSQFDQQSNKYSNLQSPTNSNSFQRPSSTPSPALSAQGSHQQQSSGSKVLKCVLPPVSQDQFDRYAFINTDELVKKVKDLLSKFSISQRLFGECILGLSQGSVSDLLARPKPWPMLTQKGREPFIRMQMFIDDPEAIKKLMANQYKSPSNSNVSDKVSRPLFSCKSESSASLLQPNSVSVDTTAALSKIVSQTLQSSNLFNQQNAQSLSQMFATITHTQNLLNLTQHQHQLQQSQAINDSSNDSEMKSNVNMSGGSNLQAQLNIIPYDISTMSTMGDLNTEEITNRVKETLLNNNIGQKLFGEAVLNLSQGTVSELLSKPKPWNTLSIKGREPYLRMYMWLNDMSRLEKLNEWKEEKNLLKRSNTEVESDHQKPKRRFIFSEEQKDQLMNAFKYDPYPAVNQMEALASKLNLQTRTVINWFHNHRMRIRYKSSTGHQLQHPSQSASPVSQSRNRSNNQNSFDEFTKSLQAYTNGGNNSGDRETGSGSGLRMKEGGNNQGRQQSGFYNYSNDNDTETMNDDDEGGYDDEDYNETSIDNNDESNVANNNVNTTEEDEQTNNRAAKAALSMLKNNYHLPEFYFGNRINSKKQYENERSKAHTEDEDDGEDILESSIQGDLDTDQEAEINSMYIPGDSDTNNNMNSNNENNDEDEDYCDSSIGNIYNNAGNQYSSSDNDLKSQISQNNLNSGKRRKPHNPQKLSFALNLLNSKLQFKQEKVENDNEQDPATE